ncbi:hypothetical protein J4429_02020 [Candidatus Pacearchaeota archaeon]|nr:hypothetical protein [Candidatus Pacearchaeota archaeon]
MENNLEYELDRTTVTPKFLRGISEDIPMILSEALKKSKLKVTKEPTPLGAEAAEKVYIILRSAINQERQKRNEPTLTDTELVKKLKKDRDFYVRKLGSALLYYELRF